MPTFTSRLATERAWVDPYALPKYMDASDVSGNAPHDVKQLTLNTLGAYGVGKEDCFAHIVGRRIHITEMDIEHKGDKAEVTVIAEVQASREMLNGAGTVHGGCLCYLIDKCVLVHPYPYMSKCAHFRAPLSCASFPLVALGILRNVNGVGVTQSMNIFFHAPASLYVFDRRCAFPVLRRSLTYPTVPRQTIMQIKSVSVTLGGRIMTSRCEVRAASPSSPASLNLER